MEEAEFVYPDEVDLPGYKPTLEGHPAQIKRAAKLIAEAQRPVILAGHGIIISQAYEEVRELAEKAQVPVITTLLGIGSFPDDHLLCVGMPGMHGMGLRQPRDRGGRPAHSARDALRRQDHGQDGRLRHQLEEDTRRDRPLGDRQERQRGRADRRGPQAGPPRVEQARQARDSRRVGPADRGPEAGPSVDAGARYGQADPAVRRQGTVGGYQRGGHRGNRGRTAPDVGGPALHVQASPKPDNLRGLRRDGL